MAKTLIRGCTPDVVFTRVRLALFVDGCFWHSCPQHGQKDFRGPNAALWRAKLLRNSRNDRRAEGLACELGYQVVRVWECDVNQKLHAVASTIEEQVRRRGGLLSQKELHRAENRIEASRSDC